MRELARSNPDCIIEWVMKVKVMNRSSYRDVVGDVEDRLLALGLPPLSHSQLYERSRTLFESTVKTTDVCDASGFLLNKYGGGSSTSGTSSRSPDGSSFMP